MRAVPLLLVVACAARPEPQPPKGTIADPGVEFYRDLWLRLAAEQNETTPGELARVIQVESSELTCPDDCMLEVAYVFSIGWLTMHVRDKVFVREHGAPRWFSEAEIRDDLAKGFDRVANDTVEHANLRLAFGSREEARAAFVNLFGGAPQIRDGWAYSYGKGRPYWQHPTLERDVDGDCAQELDLVTGVSHREQLCITRR
jgi:hypothetical protein